MHIHSLGAIVLAGLILLAQNSLHAAGKNSNPSGVLREGSLCNRKLILDTSIAAAGRLAQMGYTYDSKKHTFRPYVLSLPQGAPGDRRWTERWVYFIDGKQVPITIDFHEAGADAADYTFRR
jgi:hypothetical protein